MKRAVCLCAVCAAIALAGDSKNERFFDQRVAPILTKRCLGCHNDELNDGGISFLDRDSLLKIGNRGPAITPGKPEDSVLVDAIRHDGEVRMPPGPKLPPAEIALLTEWVRRGAPWGKKMRRPARVP